MTDNPIDYSICMYLENGECIGTWKPTLNEALDKVKTFSPHDGIVIVKVPYSERANRHVIERAKNLHDSGIYTSERKAC